ncbi:hypothetical protein DFH07DRAFT_950370 [Mycena maculata]|uniref:NADH:flavin oxidoreductase/NADH oxidase N-terminal domain-containing protein n=1 Tax=Mycena maculata TaxID=230809 RepID=A0AAD7K886_9AGAR|nr:hypothetical protein DFH07DRAFT_950370 [Mycena maculata]
MSALFTPLKLGGITIPNRLGMSAITRNRSSKTVPNEIMKQYYEQRAVGGAGLIVTEGTLITPQGTEWPDAPGIWNQEQIEGWKKITDAVHAPLVVNLFPALAPHPEAPEQIAAGVPVYAPSAISAPGGKFRYLEGAPGYVIPTEIADPTVIIAQFKQAAINAKEAGFDGVELLGGNGYLVHQFLDSLLNTLRALIEVYGPDVAIKLNPAGGYNDVGMPLQETIATFGYLLREVDKLKLSYVALFRYMLRRLDPDLDGSFPRDYTVWVAPRLDRQDPECDGLSVCPFYFAVSVSVPPNTHIFVSGSVMPAEAEELVSGKAAGVFLGLTWICHPDLGKRIRAGMELDTVPDYETLYVVHNNPAVGILTTRRLFIRSWK